MTDYVHDTTQDLEKRLWVLQEEIAAAELEIAHATHLNVDLVGAIAAAREHSLQCAAEIDELKAIMERVSAGYSYWEREGFEAGIEAIGETGGWEHFADVPAPGIVMGNARARVRLPIDVQSAYQQALGSRLFHSFSLCYHVEADDEIGHGLHVGEASYYLFGIVNTRVVQPRGALFLVAQWKV